MNTQRIAIIGAGWSGLQIATVLRECGYDVRVFEQLDDVGGTWHPANAYAGLAIHTPAFRCQFHGFDGWRDKNRLSRLPAPDVFDNCRAFADAKELRPLINLRHRVLAIRYDSASRASQVIVRDDATGLNVPRHSTSLYPRNSIRLASRRGRATNSSLARSCTRAR